MKQLTSLFNKIKLNLFEYYIQTLIIVGLPLVALIYIDLRAAFTTFVVVSIVVGLLSMRGTE